MNNMFLEVRAHFDAAHNLNNYVGECSRLHGHRWEVKVGFKIKGLRKDGLSEDFKEVKEMVKSFLPDHYYLNEYFNFNPTAENIAQKLFATFDKMTKKFLKNLALEYVELYETPETKIIVRRK